MTPSVREARQDDVHVLCRLVDEMGYETSPEQMKNRLRFVEESPFDSLHVCEEDGTVIGLLGFRLRENVEEESRYGEISALVVAHKARGRGIGRLLVAHAEKLAAEKGCKGTWLVSGLGRKDAHDFYEKLGYEITGYRFVKPLR